MDVFLGLVFGVLDSISHLKAARLVVRTVGAGYQFSVGIISWEPGLKIVLLGSSIIQLTCTDEDDSIRETKRLHEGFRYFDHSPMLGNGLFRFTDHKLLNLLKLMDPEDTPCVLTMSTSLLSEARRISSEQLRHVLLLKPLTSVVG